MASNQPDGKRLRISGMKRVGMDIDTKEILLSLHTGDGQELLCQIPRDAIGLIVVALLESAKLAAEAAGEPAPVYPRYIEKMISEGLRSTNIEVAASVESIGAILTFHTVAGMTFDFHVRHEQISQLRVGLRQAESLLNQSKRRDRHRGH